MDLNSAITILIGMAGVVGGYMGGRKNASVASDTVSMLQTQIETLKDQCSQIPVLLERIAVLEEMVTQRAKVDEVLGIVTEIREKLDNA